MALQLAVRPVAARAYFSQPPPVTQALRWLDANTPAQSVVATLGWLDESTVGAYTHNLTYTQPDWWTSVPRAERVSRRLLRAAMFGVPPEFLAASSASHAEDVRGFKQAVNDLWIGDERVDVLTELQVDVPYLPGLYGELYQWPLEGLLAVYRVDYLWVGPWEMYAGRRDYDREPALTLVYGNELVRIYAVRREAVP
jgi:hypothetical protein